jgi:hypothetical protein
VETQRIPDGWEVSVTRILRITMPETCDGERERRTGVAVLIESPITRTRAVLMMVRKDREGA